MGNIIKLAWLIAISFSVLGCSQKVIGIDVTAADILGNPKYLAFSYGANLTDVSALFNFNGLTDFDGKHIYIKNIYYSQEWKKMLSYKN